MRTDFQYPTNVYGKTNQFHDLHNVAISKNQILSKEQQSDDIHNLKTKQNIYEYLLYIILIIISIYTILIVIINVKKLMKYWRKRRVLTVRCDQTNQGPGTVQEATPPNLLPVSVPMSTSGGYAFPAPTPRLFPVAIIH